MFKTAVIAARHRQRIGEITAILVRYGLDDLLRRLGLAFLLKGPARNANDAGLDDPGAPQRLRLTIEALGPVFVKLGQILSTRADLLPPEWIAELEKLQSHVSPVPWEEMQARIEADLGAPPQTLFAAFDTTPLAAGSIAQVYRARLTSGEAVVVKVRRPGLRARVEADLKLLSHLVGLIDSPDIVRYRPADILTYLGDALREELDLSAEGRNCQAIAANLASRDDIEIPRIFWEWSGERLLVQGFIDGLSPNDATAIKAAGLDGPLLARRGAEAFLHMALIDGLFHADPHPGNLRALPDNRVGFIDFGMVGRIGTKRREQILALLAAMVRGHAGGLNRLLLEWSGEDTDISALESAAEAYIVRQGGGPLQLSVAITDLMALARTHHLVMPPDLALLFKALITADGVMRRLDPGFDIVAVSEPVVRQLLGRRFGIGALGQQAGTMATDLYELAGDAPDLIRLLMHRLRQGRLQASIDLKGLEPIGSAIENAAVRIGVAIVTAAFALGIAPRLLTVGPVWFGLPLTGIIGAGVIVAGMVWLLRPRKR